MNSPKRARLEKLVPLDAGSMVPLSPFDVPVCRGCSTLLVGAVDTTCQGERLCRNCLALSEGGLQQIRAMCTPPLFMVRAPVAATAAEATGLCSSVSSRVVSEATDLAVSGRFTPFDENRV